MVGSWLGHEHIPQMAAALAYRTIFSLIPVLILSLLVLRLFQDERKLVEQMLGKALELAGISQLQLSDSAEVSVQGRLEELVRSFSGVSFTGIGLVSAATLIYAAMSLIIEVENSFNRIYGAARGRSAVRRIMQYWMLLTLGPVLVFASFYTAEKFSGFAASFAQEGASVLGPWVLGVTGYVVSVMITGLLLLVVYLVIPNARVQLRAAACGALLGGVLLELGKYGFKLYLDHAAYGSIYGPLALVPLFLLWIYITWVIVLFGLRSAYLIQHGHRLALLTVLQQGPARLGAAQWIDPSTTLTVVELIAKNFARGRPVDAAQLSAGVGIPEPAVIALLGQLRAARVVHALEGSGERFALARPAETITLAELLRIGHELAGGADAIGLAGELQAAQMRACAGRTLADVINKATASQPAADGPAPSEIAHA